MKCGRPIMKRHSYVFGWVALILSLPVCVGGVWAQGEVIEPPVRLEVLTPEVGRYRPIEFSLGVPRRYADPFDPHEVDLTLVIRSPAGQTRRLPAFSTQQYELKMVPRSGRMAVWMYPSGQPVWKVRFAPAEVGRYRAVAELRDRDGLATSAEVEFRCVASNCPGFVRVSRRDPRFFEFANGRPFFPIGQNVAFIGESQYVTLSKVDEVFQSLSANGANWLRIWTCCHDWALAIEARKSAWGRSWNWHPPIVPTPSVKDSGRKCLQLTAGKGASLSVSPSHSVALRPRTEYTLTGRIKTEPQTHVQVISGRHRLETAITSGSGGKWQTFRLPFTTGDDEYWLGRTAVQLQGKGAAWLDALSLRETSGGPELLWEADVNRKVRGFYNPVDCFMLDHIVALARQHGIYLQLCLLTRDLYMDSLKDEQDAEYQRAIDDAKNLLRYAVARWGYSTAVVTWEYFNEQDPNLPTDRFYRELGEYLQQIDIYQHLRCTSTWHPSPRDWRHPQLDVADTHFYLRPAPNRKYVDEVVAALGNAAELRRWAVRKPALIGEFGLANAKWQPTEEMKDSPAVIDFHNGLWASALSGASGTAMFWWWERLDQRSHYRHYRPLANFVADIPWTTAGLQSARVRAVDARVRAHGLAGSNQAYLWIFDPNASFENVVVHKAKPEKLADIKIEMQGLAGGNYRIEWWNTQTGEVIKEQSVTISERPLRFAAPPFTRDVAAKILPASYQYDPHRPR
jgi:hypothetical protein